MKKALSLIIAIFVLGSLAATDPALLRQKQLPRLKADLTIGVEEGDENLIFGSITRVDLDKDGRIYMLDYKNAKVRIFDPAGKALGFFYSRRTGTPGTLPNWLHGRQPRWLYFLE